MYIKIYNIKIITYKKESENDEIMHDIEISNNEKKF